MTTVTDKAGKAEEDDRRNPRAGMDRVRDTSAWRTASIMTEAAREAHLLCDEIGRAVQDAYFSRKKSDPYPADVAVCADTLDKASEARTLLQMALDHLNSLTGYNQEPPW